MITTLLFELSGTLVDWETSLVLTARDLLPEVPEPFRAGLEERLKSALAQLNRAGDSRGLVQDPKPLWRLALPAADEKVIATLAKRSMDVLDVTLYEDVPSALLSMREQYSLGIVSANPAAGKIVARTGIGHLFDPVVSASGSARSGGKMIQRALTELKAEGVETAYIGCSYSNAREASALGLTVVWVTRKDSDAAAPEGVKTVRGLEELPELLANSSSEV